MEGQRRLRLSHNSFLVASHDSIRGCVRPSVGPSVRPSVGPLVRHAFFFNDRDCAKLSLKQLKEFQNGEAGRDSTTHNLFRMYELVMDQ